MKNHGLHIEESIPDILSPLPIRYVNAYGGGDFACFAFVNVCLIGILYVCLHTLDHCVPSGQKLGVLAQLECLRVLLWVFCYLGTVPIVYLITNIC